MCDVDPIEYEDRSFSLLKANINALVLVGPPVAIAFAAFVKLHGFPALYLPVDRHPFVSLLLIAVGIVAHEVLHAIAWKLTAKPPKGAVRLGFYWKALTPYAHCSVPMSARDYQTGAVTPGIILGVIPMLLGLFFGWGGWMMFGLLFTLAAGGDALIIWLLRGVPGDRLVKDHPSRAGCLLLPEETRTDSEAPA